MKLTIVALALMTAGCYPNPYYIANKEDAAAEAAAVDQETIVTNAVRRGDLTVSYIHYLPNLKDGRWFKIPDQYGCMWWINSGHKFDDQQIDVDASTGKANCPDDKYAPPKSVIYRDRKGNVIDPFVYGNSKTQ